MKPIVLFSSTEFRDGFEDASTADMYPVGWIQIDSILGFREFTPEKASEQVDRLITDMSKGIVDLRMAPNEMPYEAIVVATEPFIDANAQRDLMEILWYLDMNGLLPNRHVYFHSDPRKFKSNLPISRKMPSADTKVVGTRYVRPIETIARMVSTWVNCEV